MRKRVSIAEPVIASIAGLAATAVEGVSGLRGTVAEHLKAILSDEGGRHRHGRGVLTRLEADGAVRLTLHLAVEYGHPIHEVARAVQERVRREVEEMTGLRVRAVDVYVSDLVLPEGEQAGRPAPAGAGIGERSERERHEHKHEHDEAP